MEPDPNNRIGRVTTKGKFSEYPVPSKNIPGQVIPNQITAGPDGAVWFTAVGKQGGGPTVVDRISTKGEFKEFKVPGGRRDLWGITTGPDGALWFCENMSNKVVRMTTGGGFTEYPTPTKKVPIQSGTSFVISPTWIVSGPRKTIWFTENGANNIAVLRQTNAK